MDTLIYWLPLVVAAILGGSVVFPADEGRARTPHGWLGAWLAACGSVVTLSGLWIWITSIEERGQSFGGAVFLVGAAGAFVGLQLVGRGGPDGRGTEVTLGPERPVRGGDMFDARGSSHVKRGWFGRSIVAMIAIAIVTCAVPAGADTPPVAERRFSVMTYNVYLGADLQPLFGETDPIRLIQKAATIFAHLDLVDFRVRAVAIADQIIEQDPDVVALQEVSLWQTAPRSDPSDLTTRYDFLRILLSELGGRGHPFRAVSVNPNFTGTLPIDFAGTRGTFTDRNVIIVPVDESDDRVTWNAQQDVYDRSLEVPVAGMVLPARRGWASIDVRFRGKPYRLFDTHFEAFDPAIRTGQVRELVDIMSASPYPVVLTGDLNVYPKDVRPEDAAAWGMLTGAGFVDAWTEAACFEPRFTAGQTDDLDNVPSALDNTVDYVLYATDVGVGAVDGSCDIAGEELDDRTDTTPALWPSDHAAVVVDMRIAKP